MSKFFLYLSISMEQISDLIALSFSINLNSIIIIIRVHSIIMSKNNPTSAKKLSEDNPLFKEVNWVNKKVDYQGMNISQLQEENHRILVTLKLIQNRLSKDLQQKKIADLAKKNSNPENVKALEEKIKNNEKYIEVLKKQYTNSENRKNNLNEGLESKTIDLKFAMEKKLTGIKNELKIMKLQQHQTQKRLVAHGGNKIKPEHAEEHQRMEEELKYYSVRYVRLLDQYNKSAQKLAIVLKTQLPDVDIPEDIYDKQLQERQETQFKEYQGIVKLCNVLSHRNDSEHNKAHRQYTLKLKDLEKVIMKLGQLDQAITTKEGEVIQSKKNLQLFKVKLQSNEKYDSKVMRLSQNSIPRTKSYATNPGLPSTDRTKKRGSSFAKLPTNVH